jgi:mono/diheme cytochrome c family protein
VLLEWRLLGCALLVSGLLVACGPGSESGSTPPSAPEPSPASGSPAPDAAQGSAAATAEAEQIFATRCYTCHGSAGAGDGPASASLTPKPRNFQDPAWQQSVSDEHIEQIIQYGGAAVGRSPAMPGNPDLTAKPEVVAALRTHVRGLAPR